MVESQEALASYKKTKAYRFDGAEAEMIVHSDATATRRGTSSCQEATPAGWGGEGEAEVALRGISRSC